MVVSGSIAASIVAVALGPACSTPGVPVSSDGLLSEWSAASQIATDPAGDATGAFDVTSVSADSRGTILRLRFDTGNTNANLQSGNAGDGTLRIELTHGASSFTIDLRSRFAYLDGDTGNTVSWNSIGWSSAPTYAALDYEAIFDAGSAFGVAVGDTITIDFSGSDSLAAPVSFTLTAPADPAPVIDTNRPGNSDFRIASINTLNTGLLNGARAPALGRLIVAMNADIYFFCEEYNSNAGQLASIMDGFFAPGPVWNIEKSGDNVIASTFPVTGVPTGSTRYASALVQLPSGPVFVVSVHLKCCGFAGDSSDLQRITQAQDIAQLIADFRAGNVNGGALAAFAGAPVIISGDWNLVGSRIPLTTIEDGATGPGLVAPQVRRLVGNENFTWRSPTSSFWPGRLDLIAYSPANLRRLKAFSLDSTELDVGTLTALGLQADDSDASDHMMLVSDFVMTCGADTDGDGAVDLVDLQNVLFSFGQSTDPFACADIDGNGDVDLSDLQAVLFSFGQACGTL